MATITVKDANSNDVVIQQPLAPGQAAMAASVPVVIASDQTAVAVSGTVSAAQSGAFNITNISGTVSLPTGAATETGVQDIVTAVESGTIGVGTAGSANADVLSVQGIASMTPVVVGGNVANDAADSGNPLKVGGKATTSLTGGTNVAAADRVDAAFAVDGAQLVRDVCLENIVSGLAAITDGSSTSVIAAQGSGIKTYVTTVVIANSSATAVTVDLRDGTAGSVKATFPVPANTSGVALALATPLPFSANTIVAADPSAAASTVTVTLIGFTSKI